MKRQYQALVVILAMAAGAAAPMHSARADKPADDATRRGQEALGARIATEGLHVQMPFAKLLAALEARLPPNRHVALSIDEKAFGKDAHRLAEIPVALPAIPRRMTLGTALRLSLAQCATTKASCGMALGPALRAGVSQSSTWELDYDVLPTGLVITQARHGARAAVYDLHGIIALVPRLRLEAASWDRPGQFHGVPANDSAAWLIRLIANEVELEAWESVTIANGTRLTVFASPNHQRAIKAVLFSLPRLADLAVVMNARLYEVDRAFFRKHIAPLVVAASDSKRRVTLLPIDGSLLKRIAGQKLVLASNDVKLAPERPAEFLSLQRMVRLDSGPALGQPGRAPIGSALAGVAFSVRPRVSPDRVFLKLHVTQNVNRLVAIDMGKRLNAISGKHEEFAAPNLHASCVAGTIVLADGAPFLMPVDFQPPGAQGEDKVWLLVARPRIWSQAEQDEQKAGNVPADPFIWDQLAERDEPPAAPPLPLTDDVQAILQAVLTNVLSGPLLQYHRDFYGTAGDNTLDLVAGASHSWPKSFNPGLHGFRLVKTPADPFDHPRRILGIRLDDFQMKKVNPTEAAIEMTLLNVGGSANGGVIGACNLSYSARRVGQRWVVTLELASSR